MLRQSTTLAELARIGEAFALAGPVVEGGLYGTGHIHDTHRIVCSTPASPRAYIFQRINTQVFPDVEALMSNILRVTAHIQRKLESRGDPDADRGTLHVIPSRDGAPCWLAPDGDCWRVYDFIEGAQTYDTLTDARQAREAAAAFARFQQMLADLPAPPLHDVIPRFHSTPHRYAALEEAIRADPHGRAPECRAEIEFIRERSPEFGTIARMLADGSLPTRVTHNDTKVNNVMLDSRSGRAVCVIDLDTVMNGSVLFDFGDQIRSAAGRFRENQKDHGSVSLALDYFEALVQGYLDAGRDFLTDTEVAMLPFSGLIITLTIGIRFLTDYLQGDTYFKTSFPGENLVRCRNQLALARSIEQNRPALEDIVERYWRCKP